MQKIKRVIIPVDLSDGSRVAAEQGAFFAKLLDVEVSIITVDDTNQFMVSAMLEQRAAEAKQQRLDEVKKIAEHEGVSVSTLIKKGVPSEEIIQHATEEDLIVMASQGKKGYNRLMLGSVSEEVLRSAPCSVMIIKPRNEQATDSLLRSAQAYTK